MPDTIGSQGAADLCKVCTIWYTFVMGITNELRINTRPGAVWSLTIDVENWPKLTPTITSVERLDSGPLRIGSTARIKQPGQRPAVWTVTKLEPERRFEWETTVAGTRMVGTHDIRPEGDATINTLGVELAGPFAWALRLLAGRSIRKAITTENLGFQEAAERQPSVD